MFKSKDVNQSPFMDSVLLSNCNETSNGIFPKITSTPLNPQLQSLKRSKVPSPALTRQTTPRKYSLSEINSPSSSANSCRYISNSPGPLLASLNFHDNVSLYEETKSSGLARRIVSYKEEAEQEKYLTHQEKYSSPGLFPVVHLFKKTAPEQSLKRVKVKLANTEYLRSYSPQHKSKVLEEITKPRLYRQLSLPPRSQLSDAGTKSVLDALKEISRKRIHSNEEYDYSEESGKRQKTDLHNGTSSVTNKRGRADSPLLDQSDSPSSKQTKKKFCVSDEFAASRSSSDFSYLAKSEPLGAKRKTICTSTESLIETKQVKRVNVETQTAVAPVEQKPEESEAVPQQTTRNPKRKDYPLKVFDDAPLQRIRKSRLAALMGTIMGKDIVIPLDSEPKAKQIEDSIKNNMVDNAGTENAEVQENVSKTKDEADVPVKSIQGKADKHVHFTLPITSSPCQMSSTQTSVSVETPIISDSIIESPVVPQLNLSPASGQSITLEPSNLPLSAFNYGSPNSEKEKSDVNFIPILGFPQPDKISPLKPGGFKFDLKDPAGSDTSKSIAPTINFPNIMTTTSGSTATTSSSGFILGKTLESGGTCAFSGNSDSKSEQKLESSFELGKVANTFAVPKTSEAISEANFGGFSFAAPSTTSAASTEFTPSSASIAFGSFGATPVATTAAEMVKVQPSFGFGVSAPATSNPKDVSVVKPQPTFSFPTVTTADTQSSFKPTFSFGTTTSTLTVSSQSSSTQAFSFTAPTTSTASQFVSKMSAVFGGTISSSTAFVNAAPTTTAAPTFEFGASQQTSKSGMFGSAAIPTTTSSLFSPPVTTSPSTFGTVTASAISAPAFGSSSFASSTGFKFSAPTSSSLSFGNGQPTGFGPAVTTASSSFGSTQFGHTATTTAASFGSGQSAFGTHPSTTTSASFGSTDSKALQFKTNVFGPSTTASPFGNSSFGASATQASSLFGSATTTSAPSFASNTFGSSTVTSSAASSMFGSNTAAPIFSFGSTNKQPPNPFGTATTTSASSTFGGTSSFSSVGVFNSNGGFGTISSGFGRASPNGGFGVTSAPSFGQSESKPTFAFGGSEPKVGSSFGSPAGSSTFGNPGSQAGGFGTTGAFGTPTTNGFGSQPPNGGLNFGSTNTPSAAPFTFGSGTSNKGEASKPTFNFTGNSQRPSFGAPSNPPPFGASSSFSSGVPSPAGGVFTIGSGSTSGTKPRQPLRARRRNV
ncbi:nuclear pore complex protein DDB_G0274915-like [Euwallacea fornicatus]|uniref:nuclear pore complex protein DDB_G0274915-like n=1 Tax=Euwallacea fornicatus TaxID=995702 RepID=UPI00338E3FE5